MNDDEVRMLTEQPTLLKAARDVMEMGPSTVVVKQGEYGAALFTGEGFFSLPAYPLETVIDPTGAGDSFAGGFLGYLVRGLAHRRRHAAPRHDLRIGARLLQRRAVRHRARADADARPRWTPATTSSGG